jgi:hypothetical protein
MVPQKQRRGLRDSLIGTRLPLHKTGLSALMPKEYMASEQDASVDLLQTSE